MAILIDPPAWPAHGRLWSHLISDASIDELHVFAAENGIPRRGFERDHYDVPAESYDLLVAAGALPVSGKEVVSRLRASGLRKRKAGAMAHRSAGRELLRPPRLNSGDLVAVTAPAGVVWPERLRPGVERLQSWGLRVRVADHVFDRTDDLDYLAGSDAVRASDFTAAWADPDVSMVMLARGGYGTQRMLDLLDWRRLAEASPKVICGFSDVTAMHQAVESRLGLVSVHGHVATSLGAATAESAERLRRLLFEPDRIVDLLDGADTSTVVGGAASGVIVGGNLMVLAASVGTMLEQPAAGGIVVIEDVHEEPYRLDRELTQLLRSGWFDGARGIVGGAFTDCGDPAQVLAVLTHRLGSLGIPMVVGADIGHTSSTLPVPLGVMATLDADAHSLTLARPALA